MQIKPFRGLRPRPDLAARIPSYPYDVVSAEEARELARDDPYSFLHVIRPEIDLDPDVNPHDDRVYARGRENLAAMIENGWLARDARPAYYVYQLVMDGRAQTGILGASAVRDYVEDRIKKHEHTRPDKEEDRVRLNDALSAHPGPVFLTYRGLPEINAVVKGILTSGPAVDFTAPDGIAHRLWVVDDPALVQGIERLFTAVRETYVADGHHRAAAAARVGALRQARTGGASAEGSAYFMTALFPVDQIRVYDYNRVVRDLNGLDPQALVSRLDAAGFRVKRGHAGKKPPAAGSFGMYVAGRWYLLTAPAESIPDDVLGRLDVSILTRSVLEPILGVGDQRTDPRIDFVGGIRGMDELERRVNGDRAAVAFALYPTSLEDVMRVADAGQVMPPKSTWFEPKLRSGMVIQPLDEL